jgi:hypothetical protein
VFRLGRNRGRQKHRNGLKLCWTTWDKSYRIQQQQQLQEQSNNIATRCKLQPDVQLYATIMNLFAKRRRPEQAQALYDKLRIAPTRTTLAQTFLDPSRFNTFQLVVGCLLGQSGKGLIAMRVSLDYVVLKMDVVLKNGHRGCIPSCFNYANLY